LKDLENRINGESLVPFVYENYMITQAIYKTDDIIKKYKPPPGNGYLIENVFIKMLISLFGLYGFIRI
jgi:hypothetical protein